MGMVIPVDILARTGHRPFPFQRISLSNNRLYPYSRIPRKSQNTSFLVCGTCKRVCGYPSDTQHLHFQLAPISLLAVQGTPQHLLTCKAEKRVALSDGGWLPACLDGLHLLSHSPLPPFSLRKSDSCVLRTVLSMKETLTHQPDRPALQSELRILINHCPKMVECTDEQG